MSARRILPLICLTLSPVGVPAQQPIARDTVIAATGDPTYRLPLKPTRRARFTVDEGTWISLDVSPDGRTIVFDLLGDLYTLPIGGGKATRLVGGMALDVQPRFSPDGRHLLFVSDRTGNDQIWTADVDGRNPRQITRNDELRPVQPMWTPDGEYIVANGMMFHKDGGNGVPIIGMPPAPGTGRGQPPNPNAPTGGAYAFTPDGRYMYYAVQVTGARGAPLQAQDALERYQISVLDRTTGRSVVRTHEYGGAFKPMMSPDGKYLVYATRVDAKTGLRLRDLATGDERWLARDFQHDAAERNSVMGILPNAAFLPDGSALVAFNKGKLWRIAVPSGATTPIPFSADVEQDLGPLVRSAYSIPDSFTVRQIRDAVPSPDGKTLAFTALDKLYLLDLACGKECAPRRVTRNNLVEQSPAWSPDGRYLAFATWDDAKGGDIYRVRAPGGGGVTLASADAPEKLTRIPALYTKLAYSPAGDRIVFVHSSRRARAAFIDNLSGAVETGLDLAWIPAAGGDMRLITMLEEVGTAQANVAPHFVKSDSDRVYFNTSGALTSIRYDGTDRRTVVRAPGTSILSPKGDRAINLGAIGSWSIYLFAMPRTGNESLTVNIAGTGASGVPLRLVSRTGGEFGGWAPDGRSFFYSLGHSFFRYDLAKGDSIARAAETRRAPGDSAGPPRRATSSYAGERLDVTIRVARDRAQGAVVLRGARIITMRGAEVIPSGDVVVTNGRIIAVGPTGTVPVPSGARTIDVSGKTIIPGWVDVHAHMWPPWMVHKTQVPQYYENLAWGVTTVRDPQTSSSDVITYADRQAAGEIIGPRYLSTGPGVFSRDEVRSLEEAREHLRRYSTDFWNTETLKQYVAGDRRTRQWVVLAAKELGLTPTTEGAGDFKMSISEMIDGYAGHEHAYEIYPLYADVAKLAAASGITYTPTLIIAYGGPTGREYFFTRENPHDDAKVRRFWFHPELDHRVMRRSMWGRDSEYVFWGVAEAANRFLKDSAHVGLGSHGEFQGLGAHWELWMMQMGGMSTFDVLRVGTIYGAESIGMAKDLGSLEAGKVADLQVLDKNPLDDIRNTNTIRYVMQNGRLFDGNTLDEVWPTARKAGPFWWSEEERRSP